MTINRLFFRRSRPSPLILLLLMSLVIGGDAFHSPSFRKFLASSSNAKSSNENSPEARRLFMTISHPYPNETSERLYDVPNSGWKSPEWNWGSARGTGHDCAAICRRRWGDRSDRRKLVRSLLSPAEFKAERPDSEVPFEEVKLILGLAWQRGRWDGSDGGPGGYGSVLATMAEGRRYEQEDEVISALNFVEDVSERFATISRNADELKRMKCLASEMRGKHAGKEEVFMARRTCAGMVLDAMNFVDNGL
ncbi:hypothetical protein ACHAWF_017360 [Thalassiosira exigua]